MEIKIAPPLAGGAATQSVAGEGAQRIVAIARSWIGTPYVHQASVKGAGCVGDGCALFILGAGQFAQRRARRPGEGKRLEARRRRIAKA